MARHKAFLPAGRAFCTWPAGPEITLVEMPETSSYFMMPTESLTNREWLPEELLSGSKHQCPGWFLDMKHPTWFFFFKKSHFWACPVVPVTYWPRPPCSRFRKTHVTPLWEHVFTVAMVTWVAPLLSSEMKKGWSTGRGCRPGWMFPLLDTTHRIGWSPASASKCTDDLETWRYKHYIVMYVP